MIGLGSNQAVGVGRSVLVLRSLYLDLSYLGNTWSGRVVVLTVAIGARRRNNDRPWPSASQSWVRPATPGCN